MRATWLEWKQDGRTQRARLRAGMTLIGGSDADVPHPDPGQDQLQVWDVPAKVVLVGSGPLPRIGEREGSELAFAPGDVLTWRGVAYRLGGTPAEALGGEPGGAPQESGREAGPVEAALEELDLEPLEPPAADRGREIRTRGDAAVPEASAPPARSEVVSRSDAVAWSRVKAGLFVELGIADRQVARTWQQAIARGEFDPDACAHDVLRVSHFPESDPRLVERSARLERDLVMSPLQTGARRATRRARKAAKGGIAFLVAQLLVVLVYSVILLTLLVLIRLQWGVSLDAWIDDSLAALRNLAGV